MFGRDGIYASAPPCSLQPWPSGPRTQRDTTGGVPMPRTNLPTVVGRVEENDGGILGHRGTPPRLCAEPKPRRLAVI